ncbi:flagellar protein FliO/FliZ [Anaerobacterium chartisolvens]|uniref:Flagellar protein FliO/FliZ n=1 Tax=Anaerobacterium chartisolvens TaxID=1297424 RepID=A0A369B2F8_9FIRM|nr:flagellar biosynthetic protein FliO [Anaerobacterium chartisolvens]RCX15525.1 flagellar protein FliO/FliZ [Anaerobacterium chartisolvens]
MFAQVIGILLAFGSVLFLAVIFTRFMAGKAKRTMKGQYMNIVESMSLGVDKQIHLIRVDRQFVLVATAGKNVEFLTIVKLDNYVDNDELTQNENAFDFKTFFNKYLQNYKDKKNGKESKNAAQETEDESVEDIIGKGQAGAGGSLGKEVFKSNLSRLKSITDVIYRQREENGDD